MAPLIIFHRDRSIGITLSICETLLENGILCGRKFVIFDGHCPMCSARFWDRLRASAGA